MGIRDWGLGSGLLSVGDVVLLRGFGVETVGDLAGMGLHDVAMVLGVDLTWAAVVLDQAQDLAAEES